MKLLSDTNIHLENKRMSRAFFLYLWIMYAVVYMTKNCFSGALAAIVEEGSLTLTEASLINASFYIVYAPLQILGGVFADKYSPEKLIVVGLFGSAVSHTVIFFNQNFWVMLAAWMFNALIQFSLWPAVFKIVSSQLVRSDCRKMVFYMPFASSGGLILAYTVSAFIPKWIYNFAVSAISLVLAGIFMLIFCKRLGPVFVKDREPVKVKAVDPADDPGRGYSTFGILWVSGFFMVLPAVVIRFMVENGAKSMSPTMLSQCYESISPAIGNLLNILIILAGTMGMILAKLFLYPKIIKNEVVGFILMMTLCLPFLGLLFFVGELPVWMMVLSLCMVSMLLTAGGLLLQYFNMRFVKYGLSGTVAGVLNAGASFGIVLQYCLFGSLADRFGWRVVTALWIGSMVVAVACTLFSLRPVKRFTRMTEENAK